MKVKDFQVINGDCKDVIDFSCPKIHRYKKRDFKIKSKKRNVNRKLEKRSPWFFVKVDPVADMMKILEKDKL